MRNHWIKRIFPLVALLLLAPWPVAHAHTYDSPSSEQSGVRITVAEGILAPTWTAFRNAVGGVTPGDLFYIDAADNPADIVVILYITNARELIGCYRSLILKVGIYAKSASGEWKPACLSNDKPVPDTFITMRSCQVSFTLRGLTDYKITIDGGSFYCSSSNSDSGSLSPQFYLEAG
jgi:hypothetical protein